MRRFGTLTRLLAAVLCATAWTAASASVDRIRLGVYAYDAPAGVVWSCTGVVGALEKIMTEALENEVEVDVRLVPEYQQGVADVLEGVVDLGRFPNVPSNWVVHPGTSPRLLDAWRAAVVELDVEPFLTGLRRLPDGGAAMADGVPHPALVAAVEDRFGRCGEAGIRTASVPASPAPAADLAGLAPAFTGDALLELLNLIESLPASASGVLGHPAER